MNIMSVRRHGVGTSLIYLLLGLALRKLSKPLYYAANSSTATVRLLAPQGSGRQASQNGDSIVEKLSELIDPSVRKQDTARAITISFEELCKDALKKLLGGSVSECFTSKIVKEGKIREVLGSVCDEECFQNVRDLNENEKGGGFPELLQALKERSSQVKSGRECRKCIFLLDTCYNRDKAKRLEKALETLKDKLKDEDKGNSNNFKALLALLIASFTRMIEDEGYLLRAEWFPLLVRAASGALESNDKYFPVCPSKGDVAALLYYSEVNRYVSDEQMNIDTEKIINIIRRLIGYPASEHSN
jgi:hypothetical protein